MANEKDKTETAAGATTSPNNTTDAEANNTNNIKITKKFPTPQYLVTIYAKNVVLVDREDAHRMSIVVNQNWNQNLVAAALTSDEDIKKKKKIRVKIGSLLVRW